MRRCRRKVQRESKKMSGGIERKGESDRIEVWRTREREREREREKEVDMLCESVVLTR